MGSIQPLALPHPSVDGRSNLLLGQIIVVAGWGRLSLGGLKPALLQKVWIPVVHKAHCEYNYRLEKQFMFCAGALGGSSTPYFNKDKKKIEDSLSTWQKNIMKGSAD